MTLAVIDKSSDGGYSLKPLKQKQMVDGLCYLLQEIYGIENKNNERSKVLMTLGINKIINLVMSVRIGRYDLCCVIVFHLLHSTTYISLLYTC